MEVGQIETLEMIYLGFSAKRSEWFMLGERNSSRDKHLCDLVNGISEVR
jgi:hypothetical protein